MVSRKDFASAARTETTSAASNVARRMDTFRWIVFIVEFLLKRKVHTQADYSFASHPLARRGIGVDDSRAGIKDVLEGWLPLPPGLELIPVGCLEESFAAANRKQRIARRRVNPDPARRRGC